MTDRRTADRLCPLVVFVAAFMATVDASADPATATISIITNPPHGGTITGAGTHSTGAVANIGIQATSGWYVADVTYSGPPGPVIDGRIYLTPDQQFQKTLQISALMDQNFDPTTITNFSASVYLVGDCSITGWFAPLSPTFIQQPVAVTAVSGGSLTLTGGASGRRPISYQWQKDGVNIPGQTSSNLVYTTVRLANAGTYVLTASNAFGSTNSLSAVLRVDIPPINASLQPSPSSATGIALAFSVPTDLGETYVLEYKTDLSATAWNAWRVFVGDGQLKSFFEEINREIEKLFIRIRTGTAQVSLYLKMPLPGGKSWFLTVETGGESFCGKPDDDRHLPDARYFSLDFDDLSEGGGNGVQETDVPVLAAAYGVVVRKYESETYGWTVIIDHEAPYDEFPKSESGYTTLYAHMKPEPIVEQGDEVFQGSPIGIVGTTGVSTGTHVHFEVRYNGDSRSSVEELRRVRLEGLLLESYKVGCNLDGTGFYPSTNTRN